MFRSTTSKPQRKAWIGWFALSASLVACQNIDPTERDVPLDELEHQSTDNGIWQSARWDTPWLPFPGKQAVTIAHDLGATPRLVQVYVDFDRDDGCDRDNDTTALLASGTLARISNVGDASVTLRNDTKENYCIRLVLQ